LLSEYFLKNLSGKGEVFCCSYFYFSFFVIQFK